MADALIARLDVLLFHETNTIVQDLTRLSKSELEQILTSKRIADLHHNLNIVGSNIGYKFVHYDAFEILRKKEPEKWSKGEHEKLEAYEEWRTEFFSYLFIKGTTTITQWTTTAILMFVGTLTRLMEVYPDDIGKMTEFSLNK